MLNNKGKWRKRILWTTGGLLFLVTAFLIFFYFSIVVNPPAVDDTKIKIPPVIKINENLSTCGKDWIHRNKYGLWEIYVEGEPYERGLIIGELSKDLIYRQETAFVHQIYELIPSKIYLTVLKYFVGWFNRNIDSYISDESRLEIYGVSKSASDEFDYIAPKYQRILNYHAAHDIGHALQGMHMVGCTSFSTWNSMSEDSSLIVGRNFDFYAGEEFAKEKLIYFIKPARGFGFMMVGWGGMTGAVSGMNIKGLTVTLNAAESEIPTSAAAPITLVARNILQYASNIKEALRIAEKYRTFVSESIMVGSREDGRTIIIEKTPRTTELFTPPGDYLICSNHFQSKGLGHEEINLKNMKESSSVYRYNRMMQLVKQNSKMNIIKAASILRNQLGVNNDSLGFGNEKAINQLIAHHSIIFKPGTLQIWVSTSPFQLGSYIAYDLNKIFKLNTFPLKDLNEDNMTIAPDPFLYSEDFIKFKKFDKMRKRLKKCMDDNNISWITENTIKEFISCNPKYYEVYSISGDLYRKMNKLSEARKYYSEALSKEIPYLKESEKIKEKLAACKKQ